MVWFNGARFDGAQVCITACFLVSATAGEMLLCEQPYRQAPMRRSQHELFAFNGIKSKLGTPSMRNIFIRVLEQWGLPKMFKTRRLRSLFAWTGMEWKIEKHGFVAIECVCDDKYHHPATKAGEMEM